MSEIVDSGSAELGSIRWVLVELDGRALEGADEGSAQFLELDLGERRVTGFAGCNRFAGTFELEGEGLRFGPLATTRMTCPGEIMERETLLLSCLAKTSAYTVDGSELVLEEADRVLARFAAVPLAAE